MVNNFCFIQLINFKIDIFGKVLTNDYRYYASLVDINTLELGPLRYANIVIDKICPKIKEASRLGRSLVQKVIK